MRLVILWLTVVVGGIGLGGSVGGCAGWLVGSLRLRYHPDETVRAAYLAGEFVSEDVVPRAALTCVVGFFGCFVGLFSSLDALIGRRGRHAARLGDSASGIPRSPVMLFD